MQQPNIPVYLFTGFLEGGKTHIIQESMCDERFNTGEKTLIILCEEGIEELEPTSFSGQNIYLATLDSESDVTSDNLEAYSTTFATALVSNGKQSAFSQ